MVPKTPLVLNSPPVINSVVPDGALSLLLHRILLYFIVVIAPSGSSIIIHASYRVVDISCGGSFSVQNAPIRVYHPPAELRVPSLSLYRSNFL
jgi:hypothetical protein